MPIRHIRGILKLYFSHLHAIIPLPHEATLVEALNAVETGRDSQEHAATVAVVASLIAYFSAACPRIVRQELERIRLSQEYPDLLLLRQKCRGLAMQIRSDVRDSAEYVFEDVAVFYFMAMSYVAVGNSEIARTYFGHAWTVVEQLRLEDVAREHSNDVYHEMAKRLLWALFINMQSLHSQGIYVGNIAMVRPSCPLPADIPGDLTTGDTSTRDDELTNIDDTSTEESENGGIHLQRGTVNDFNAEVELFLAQNLLVRIEIADIDYQYRSAAEACAMAQRALTFHAQAAHNFIRPLIIESGQPAEIRRRRALQRFSVTATHLLVGSSIVTRSFIFLRARDIAVDPEVYQNLINHRQDLVARLLALSGSMHSVDFLLAVDVTSVSSILATLHGPVSIANEPRQLQQLRHVIKAFSQIPQDESGPLAQANARLQAFGTLIDQLLVIRDAPDQASEDQMVAVLRLMIGQLQLQRPA